MTFVVDSFRFGAPSGPVDPFSITTWHAAHWADDPAWSNPGDGNAVSSWRDGTGGGQDAAQATGTNQPLWIASAINARAALRFDGSNDYLRSTFSSARAQPCTTVLIAQMRSTAARVMVDDGDSSQIAIYWNTSNLWALYTTANVSGGAADLNAHLFTGYFSGASSTLEVDGALSGSGNPGSNGYSSGFTVGASGATAQFAPVDVAFVAVKAGALTAGELSDLEAWAADYYGLTIA